jgi:hypothetical protein
MNIEVAGKKGGLRQILTQHRVVWGKIPLQKALIQRQVSF